MQTHPSCLSPVPTAPRRLPFIDRVRRTLGWLLLCVGLTLRDVVNGQSVDLQPKVIDPSGQLGVEYWSEGQPLMPSAEEAPSGVLLKVPGQSEVPLKFLKRSEIHDGWELGPTRVGGLVFRWRIERKNPSLIQRTLLVTAEQDQKLTLRFLLEIPRDGAWSSFSGAEASRVQYETGVRERKNQTFPVAMLRTTNRVYGLIADSPGYWENRCQVVVDPAKHRLELMTGDGGDSYLMKIQPPEDARDTYQYSMDGWQSMKAGESRQWTTWVFSSPARNHYDAQVAFHLAVANAKGWNHSALEAILRNTSLYLLRRNLMLDATGQPRDGKYIFISGMSYGWKQWVSTGLYSALGLNDPEAMTESLRAVFWNRMDYEDNAQYYLIWAALAHRAGGTLNMALVRKAYDFIRSHEVDGAYVPPPLPGAPNPKGWKTYMDILPYDDDDAPASNQGFHCGALLAAQELGLPISEGEIERAIQAYRKMFNASLGFMPTSMKQSQVLGQDTLYGATLTYAVFGRKLLTDEQVLTHYRTSEKVKSKYGLRVISSSDGSLLPGHDGSYCHGGSWFFCDSGNYLLAGVHGLSNAEVDARLTERILLELRDHPAFHEDIHTVTGQPHGNMPYADYSAYIWLRSEIRRRLGQTGPDPVETTVDAQLRVTREGGALRLLDVAENASGKSPTASRMRRRVLYNFDGDSCLFTKAGSKGPVPITVQDVRRLIQEVAYEGSRVDSVLVNVNAQVMYYPTRVGTLRGTLSTPEERAAWPPSERQRFENMKAFFDAGVDPYAVMLSETKKRSREALLSFRMNDDHGNDFLRSQFLADHPDWRLGTQQYQGRDALDFAQPAVRDYTFRLIEEAVRRYESDGIELDFNRFPRFFKSGTTEERVGMMNGLVERVKQMIDAVSQERGHPMLLSVRVPSNFGRTPPTPKSARELGCDVVDWVRRGWVDFVTVSEFLFERDDLPLTDWKREITTVPVYGGIECTYGGGQKNLTAEQYRNAGRRRMNSGANGVYLFNFYTSREGGAEAYEPPFEVLQELGAP